MYTASKKKVTTREHCCSTSNQLVAVIDTEDLKPRVQQGKFEL